MALNKTFQLGRVVGLPKRERKIKTVSGGYICAYKQVKHNYSWFTNFNNELYKELQDYRRLND